MTSARVKSLAEPETLTSGKVYRVQREMEGGAFNRKIQHEY